MIASTWTVPCSSMLCIFNPIGSAISLGSYLTFVACAMRMSLKLPICCRAAALNCLPAAVVILNLTTIGKDGPRD